MAEGKTSFVLYTEIESTLEMLDDEKAGQLFKHILAYVNDRSPTLEDPFLKLAFQPIKNQLKRDLQKWERKQEQRKEAGKKSAEIRKKNAEKADKKERIERTLTTVNDRKHPSTGNGNGNGNVNGNGNGNVLSKNGEREKGRALDFLKINHPARWETDFLMKYRSKIENPKKFAEDFNDTVDQEKLEYDGNVLFGRLGKYARNWIENQSKYSKTPAPDSYESGKQKRV